MDKKDEDKKDLLQGEERDPHCPPREDPYRPPRRRQWPYLYGFKERQRQPERQHFPLLSISVDFLGQWQKIKDSAPLQAAVTNHGNAVARCAFVELIESAPEGLSADPPDTAHFERRGYTMLPPLFPHQTTIVVVNWYRTRKSGRIVAIAYDAILDPKPVIPYRPWNLPEHHKKITSIHWSNL